MKKTKLVFGVGVNDATYVVCPINDGKRSMCPYYLSWRNMLMRCYDTKYHMKHPTYVGCTVTQEWFTFSNFRLWMEKQDWQGKQLDKDILVPGNRIYSPSQCVFVDRELNLFLTDNAARRGNHPIGVSFHIGKRKFISSCNNPTTKKPEHIGYFNCENEAHKAWLKRKHELACQLAECQQDARIAQALRTRYLTNQH